MVYRQNYNFITHDLSTTTRLNIWMIRIHDRKNAPWFWLQQAVQEPKSPAQYPHHVTDSFILLCQYLTCQSSAPCGFSMPVSIHQTKSTNFLFLLQNGCYQTRNKCRVTFVGIRKEPCPFICDCRQQRQLLTSCVQLWVKCEDRKMCDVTAGLQRNMSCCGWCD